jgi:glyoxylase I family protein
MTEIRLDHVSVTVADIERAIAFYAGVLGLPLVGRGEDAGDELAELVGVAGARARWAELSLADGLALKLLQYLAPDGSRVRSVPWAPGATHIALAVEDLDAFHRRLEEAGVPMRSEPVTFGGEAAQGIRRLYATDPDGVAIELVERPAAPAVVVPELARAEAEPA